MTRINTNVSSLIAQNSLAKSNVQLQTALTRLSTGLRINSGADDPAGLIASESLKSDIANTNQAVMNTTTANEMISTADSALGEVSKLLNNIRSLITASANTGALSTDQIAANQLQVDSSLAAIDRIAQTTAFQGRNLLDGSLDFIYEDLGTGTLDLFDVTDLQITQANLADGDMNVSVVVATAATQATTGAIAYTTPTAALSIRVGGNLGSQVLSFDTGTVVADVAAAINAVADATGVEATAGVGTLTLESTGYGSDQFVQLNVLDSDGATFGDAVYRETGTDVEGTINGYTGIGKGNKLSISNAILAMSITMTVGTGDLDLSITGGGALFQLGPNVISSQQTRLGIQSVDTGSLGGVDGRLYQIKSGGDADLATDTTTAASIVDASINKVTTLRGSLGAFQSTMLETNVNALNATLEALTEAQSTVSDADFALETANLTRAQILVQSGTAVLKISNQNPQNVLALLQ